MAEIKIKLLNNEEYGIWDEIVEKSPQATVVHKLDWLQTIEKHTHSKLYLFVGYLGNQIVAAIPFFYRKSFFIKSISSPPGSEMIQNLGPIIPGYDIIKQDKREFYFREFQKELDRYITKIIKPDSISIITAPNLIDSRPYIWNDYIVTPKYNYVKNIENLDIVWRDFKKQLRKNIEGAKYAGIVIEEGNLKDYNFIIDSLSKRLDEQELIFPSKKEYLIDIFNKFYPDNIKIFVAKNSYKPITGIIVLAYKDRLSIWIGATQTEIKGVYPVDLLQWNIIEWGNKHGYRFCEILGANIPSISYFKSRYNFELEIYYSVQKSRGVLRILNAIRSIIR